jgi:hypothetical protein
MSSASGFPVGAADGVLGGLDGVLEVDGGRTDGEEAEALVELLGVLAVVEPPAVRVAGSGSELGEAQAEMARVSAAAALVTQRSRARRPLVRGPPGRAELLSAMPTVFPTTQTQSALTRIQAGLLRW